MKEIGTIKIEPRNAASSRSNKRIRREGLLPGVIYSKAMDSVAVTVKKDEFRKKLSEFGKNSGYKLEQPDGKVYTVIIKKIQMTPVSNEYMHVEFNKISFADKISVDVPIVLTGRELLDSKDVFMVRQTEHITVTGLPQDIPDYIEFDVSGKQIGDSVLLSDIVLPDGLVTEADHDLKIVSFTHGKKHVQDDKQDEESESADTGNTESLNHDSVGE